jgi:hypothetical protein
MDCAASQARDDAVAMATTNRPDRRTSAPVKEAKKRSGVLPAIERKLGQVPQLLPPLPSVAGSEPGSTPWFIGMLAVSLLALSGIGILVYVVRFIRRPHSA